MPVSASSHATHTSRQQLIALETATARHLHASWQATTVRMSSHVQAFTDAYAAQLAEARAEADANGDNPRRARVPLLWLTQGGPDGGNLTALKRTLLAEIAAFAALALAHTLAAQRAAIARARAAMQGYDLPDEATLYARVGKQHSGASLDALFRALASTTVKALTAALFAGLAVGRSAHDLARTLWQALGRAPSQALTILRTEMMGAYRDATSAIYQENPGVVLGWLWRASPDACDVCAAMDGTQHDPDETLDSHPNCRCEQEPIISASSATDQSSDGGDVGDFSE